MEQAKNMNPIQKARTMFSNMPDDVFNAWLLPIIRDHNAWPYLNVFSPHPSLQWSKYFGLYALYDVSNLLWHRMSLTFDMSCLDPISNATIDTLIKKHVHNLDTTGGVNVLNSKSRFFGFVKFIQSTGNNPAPIIGINTDRGLRILDGNHRLSALTYLGLRGHVQWNTWVGAPKI